MPQYEVRIKRTEYGFVKVTAKNKKLAGINAIEAESQGNAIWGNQGPVEIMDATKVK